MKNFYEYAQVTRDIVQLNAQGDAMKSAEPQSIKRSGSNKPSEIGFISEGLPHIEYN